jgi:hypothetical protein
MSKEKLGGDFSLVAKAPIGGNKLPLWHWFCKRGFVTGIITESFLHIAHRRGGGELYENSFVI